MSLAVFFDAKAEDYARHRHQDEKFAEIRAWTLAFVGADQQRVLDVGCGCGTVSEDLARQGHSVTGVDISPQMIAKAEANRPFGLKVKYICSDVDSVEGHFERIVCLGVFEYVEQHEQFLARLRALLIKNGRLMIQTPNGEALGERLARLVFWINRKLGRAQALPVQRHPHSARALIDLLDAAGLHHASVDFLLYYVFPFDRWSPTLSRRFANWCSRGRRPWLARWLAHTLVITAERRS